MKLAQQNKLLARIANSNAELEMKKFQREIKNKKYMWVTIDLHEIVHDDFINKILALVDWQIRMVGPFIVHLFGF